MNAYCLGSSLISSLTWSTAKSLDAFRIDMGFMPSGPFNLSVTYTYYPIPTGGQEPSHTL